MRPLRGVRVPPPLPPPELEEAEESEMMNRRFGGNHGGGHFNREGRENFQYRKKDEEIDRSRESYQHNDRSGGKFGQGMGQGAPIISWMVVEGLGKS